MADEIPSPKLSITVEHQKAIKAFLDTGKASKDLGKALEALGHSVEGSYKGKVDKVERGYQSFEKTISKLASELKGNGATAKLNELALAIEKAGGAAKLTDVQLDNVRKRIESLKAAGGTLPAGLTNLGGAGAGINFQGAGMSVLMGGGLSGALMALGPAGVAGAAGLGLVAAAGAAVTATLVDSTKAVIAKASALKDLSAETQVDVEALQKLDYAGSQVGVTMAETAKALSFMGKAILNSPEKFTQLGLSIDALRQMKPDEAFAAVAAELDKIQNPLLRAAAATEVFGKSGQSVLPMVGMNLRALGNEAESFGLVMSRAMVDAGDDLGDALDILSKLWDQLSLELGKTAIETGLAQEAIVLITKALGLAVEATATMVLMARHLGEAWMFAKAAMMGLPGSGFSQAETMAAMKAAQEYADETTRLAAGFGKLAVATATMEGRIRTLGTTTAESGAKAGGAGKKWKDLGDEGERAGKKIAEANKRIAAGNTLMESKAGADAMARQAAHGLFYMDGSFEGDKERVDAIEKILQESAERRKKIGEEIVASDAKVAAADTAIRARRAADIAKLDADSAADQREAARMRMSDINAILDQIEEQRQAAIALAKAETDASVEGVAAQQRRIKSADELAEALKKAARQQALLNSLGLIREGFSELISIFDEIGISAESNLGKAVRAAEQLASAAEHAVKAYAAYGKGDYLTAVVEGIGAIGDLVKGINTALASKTEWQRLGEELGKAIGVSLSQGLLEEIGKDSKRFGVTVGANYAAALLHLKAIFDEVGFEALGMDKAIEMTRDLLMMTQSGMSVAEDARKAFEEAFSAIADAIGDGRVSAEFLELIQLQQRFGLESKAVAAFMERQANATVGYLKTIVEHGVITEKSAAGVAAALLAQYDALLKSGKTVTEALAIIGPAFATLGEKLAALGIDGGPAFAQIAAMAAMAADEVAGPLLSAVGAVGPALNGLFNQGILTQEMFTGLAATIGETHAALVAQGFDGATALAMMQPSLQEVWELQQDLGFAVDEATQKLIDEAVAAGMVGDAHRDANERAAIAMEHVADILTRIAKFMGVDIPAAAQKGADGIEDAFGNVKIGPITVPINYDIPELPGGPQVTPAAVGFEGVVSAPRLFLTGEGGPEHVSITPLSKAGAAGGADIKGMFREFERSRQRDMMELRQILTLSIRDALLQAK